MTLNPYQPSGGSITRSNSDETDAVSSKIQLSRNPITIVAAIFAFASVLSIVILFGCLISNNPAVINNDFASILLQIVRIGVFGYLGLLLWQYQKAIKNWGSGIDQDGQGFALSHGRCWDRGSMAIGVLVIYSIFYAALLD